LATADPVRATNDYAARLVNNRQDASVMMFGRLKPGVAASQAQSQLNLMDAQLRREYPRPDGRTTPLAVETPRGASDPGSRRMVAQPVSMLAVASPWCGRVGVALGQFLAPGFCP
jgi:hypothetical protein